MLVSAKLLPNGVAATALEEASTGASARAIEPNGSKRDKIKAMLTRETMAECVLQHDNLSPANVIGIGKWPGFQK